MAAIPKSSLLSADTNPDELASLNVLILKKTTDDPGINFPGLMFKQNSSKALTAHMFPNLDGARVENMGRNPHQFQIQAILTNNIYPGLKETWKPGTLFPEVFNNLIDMLNDNSSKILQHPILGDIYVMVDSYEYQLEPKGVRDGAILSINCIETIKESLIADQFFSINSVDKSAKALDEAIAKVPDQLKPPAISLNQFFGRVTGLLKQALSIPDKIVDALAQNINAVNIGGQQVAGALMNAPAYTYNNAISNYYATKSSVLNGTVQNSINYNISTLDCIKSINLCNSTASVNANQLQDKIIKATVDLELHFIAQNDPRCSEVIMSLRQFMGQLQQMKTSSGPNIQTYVTQNMISWTSLAKILKNELTMLLSLNLGLMNQMWMPANTSIKYIK